MSLIATGAHTQPRCTCCGAALRSAVPMPTDDDRLCERCFLDHADLTASGTARVELAQFAEMLAEALDLREHETGLHSRRVACHTQVLARRFSNDEEFLRQIYWGALLHDLGKIGVPDAILLKAGRLDEAEWQVMRRHPEDGHRIVSRLPGMTVAAGIVLCHEERFDGSGYPHGLRGEEIPLGARLFAVIDTLDAITSDRPYRKGLSFAVATTEILRGAGTQFDPPAVEAMFAEEAVLRRMVAMKCMQVDPPGHSPTDNTTDMGPPRRHGQ